VEKLELVYTVGKTVNNQVSMENNIVLLKTLKMKLPYTLVTSLLGVFPKQLKIGSQKRYP
jgi:hypothetical protein